MVYYIPFDVFKRMLFQYIAFKKLNWNLVGNPLAKNNLFPEHCTIWLHQFMKDSVLNAKHRMCIPWFKLHNFSKNVSGSKIELMKNMYWSKIRIQRILNYSEGFWRKALRACNGVTTKGLKLIGKTLFVFSNTNFAVYSHEGERSTIQI